MLTDNTNLQGLVVRATDGEIGTVNHLYFDDQHWAIRYLTVDTGNWLNGRSVLISAHSVLQADWTTGRIDVSLTRRQVENAPDIDTHRPVSRQHEAEYNGYYGYPSYWEGPAMWGPSYSPAGRAPMTAAESAAAERNRSDSHLRSTQAVTGYRIDTGDDEIGHIHRFIVDDEAWMIRYLEIATTNWWPGKKVLLSPAWVEAVSWEKSTVLVAVTCDAILNCPEYVESQPITRAYENAVYSHYGRPPYWQEESIHSPSLALSGR